MVRMIFFFAFNIRVHWPTARHVYPARSHERVEIDVPRRVRGRDAIFIRGKGWVLFAFEPKIREMLAVHFDANAIVGLDDVDTGFGGVTRCGHGTKQQCAEQFSFGHGESVSAQKWAGNESFHVGCFGR